MAEDIDAISFAYDSPRLLPDRVKITSSSQNFRPKWPVSGWFERRRHL